MSCVDGAGFQCSGDTILRRDNGVALTRSGVQVYGRSTSDVLNPTNPNTAEGLALATGGTAEFRSNNASHTITVLLDGLGITWDGQVERPPIIEQFNATAGRTVKNPNGTISSANALPPYTNIAFYNYATAAKLATQSNYANNRYFPRDQTANPSRCSSAPCPTIETTGLNFTANNWNTGGYRPSATGGQRLHEDGDIHAGDDVGGGILVGGNGHGVPFPGSKGVRGVTQWSYQYGNIGYWETRDTVDISEWTPSGPPAYPIEHNTARAGIVSFGDVTDPATVPSSGSATYHGFVYGGYVSNGVNDITYFTGDADVTVNFALRTVTVTVSNCKVYGGVNDGTALSAVNFGPTPISISSTTGEANYANGAAFGAGTLSGGMSSRLFGPVSSGKPPEVGGAFSMSSTLTGATVIGGFIAQP